MEMEVYPSIAFDRRLSELFTYDISVDYPQLVTMMRKRGFSDVQIARTEIIFHTDTPSTNVRFESGEKVIPTGSYDYLTRQIGLYPQNILKKNDEMEPECLSREFSMVLAHELEHHAQETLEGGRTLSIREYAAIGRSVLKLVASFPPLFLGMERGLNAAARLMNNDPGSTAQSLAAIGSVAFASVGSLVLARPWKISYEQYRASSTELRSYEAEQNAPENLVTIRPRDC